jgi:hypothetical protein
MWLLAIAAVLNLTLWWLSYQNRGSEKIVTALVAALVGALTTSVAVIVFFRSPSDFGAIRHQPASILRRAYFAHGPVCEY